MLKENKSFAAIQIQGISAEQILQRFDTLENQIKDLKQPRQQEKDDELLSRYDVSQILGVSLVTVHNWCKSQILNPLRIGNKIRFKKSEVLAALHSVNAKIAAND